MKEVRTMKKEVVKAIKGFEIYRDVGTQRCYFVDLYNHNGFKAYLTFRSVKAAAEYITIHL